VERAERRFQAVALATDQIADELYGMAPDEAPKVIEAGRRTRERSVQTIAEATERIVQALNDAEAALGLAKWASAPGDKRWRTALMTMEIGQQRVRLDRVIAALEALPAVLESTPLPDEEQPEPEVRFGWAGGTQQAPA
jgi:hypothetical protein